VIALFVLIILSLLGTTLLTLSGTEQTIAYNSVWDEGAFDAAEAGMNIAISQLSANQDNSQAMVPKTDIDTGTYTYTFWGGTSADSASPKGPRFKETLTKPGYSASYTGKVYGGAGSYVFDSYEINATGSGPRNSRRQLQTLAEYGPIAR
jgi:Tfp pilus assembly protein PilX